MNKVKILITVSIILLFYWFFTKIIDIYALHPVFGALYELSSLVALIATFVIPIITIVFLIKSESFERRKYVLPLMINVATILVLLFFPFLFTVNNN